MKIMLKLKNKTMKKIIVLLLSALLVFSCKPTQQAVKNQRMSVSLNKKQAKGLRKASEIVNAEASAKAYGHLK
jgi:uncharacterized protein YcfL